MHIGFLHYGSVAKENFGSDAFAIFDGQPGAGICLQGNRLGFHVCCASPREETNTYWQVAQFLTPFWSLPLINPLEINFLARAWVPIDDKHTMIVLLMMNGTEPARREAMSRNGPGSGLFPRLNPNSTDWHGRWRTVANRCQSGQRLPDRPRRAAQPKLYRHRRHHHVGPCHNREYGAITERPLEHLAPSDMTIARVRRLLVPAARARAKGGNLSPSATDPKIYGQARGGQMMVPIGADWLAFSEEQKAAPPLSALDLAAAEWRAFAPH